MEENNVPNPEQFNVKDNQKEKMGPVKGLLLAILIVFLICVVGLLIRMVVAGDGDYFKPFKDIFGIEEKEEKTSKGGESQTNTSARYALLSDDVNGENVKHYRLTLDMGEYFSTIMEELEDVDNSEDEEDSYYDYDDTEDEYYDDSTSETETSGMEEMLGMATMMMQMMGDMVDGEMYFDIYFEGNEIVQVIVGYDYEKLAKNIYDMAIENADEEDLEEPGMESYEAFLEEMNNQFIELLDEDVICEAIMQDEDMKSSLSEIGIKEKDIKDAIDFNCDKGIFEVYINGTTKLKALISMGLESENLKTYADENNIDIDEDNIIESFLEAANELDEYVEYGIEFVEVK